MDRIAFRRLMSLVAVVAGASVVGLSHFEFSGSTTLLNNQSSSWKFHWDGLFGHNHQCDKEHVEKIAAAPVTRVLIAPLTPPSYRTGEQLRAKWNSSWYPVHIAQVKDGRYLIHYDGYTCSWDEWVGPERLSRNGNVHLYGYENGVGAYTHNYDSFSHHDPDHLATAVTDDINMRQHGAMVCDTMSQTLETVSKPATKAVKKASNHKFTSGEAAQVEWHGTWYDASVVKPVGDGYQIHYTGWSNSWDEVVGNNRIRTP